MKAQDQEPTVAPPTELGLATSSATPKIKGPRNDPMKPMQECTASVAPLYPVGADATVPAVMDAESPVRRMPNKIVTSVSIHNGASAIKPSPTLAADDDHIISVMVLCRPMRRDSSLPNTLAGRPTRVEKAVIAVEVMNNFSPGCSATAKLR